MAEKTSTNLAAKEIKAVLSLEEDCDILTVFIGKGYRIDLNSDQCQNIIKEMFSEILKELIKANVVIHFECAPEYKNTLFIDVCNYYIDDLNKEIERVRANIPKELLK